MNYGDELAAAWADHLAPRKPDAYSVVSTFAGCGGSSLGYSMAGFGELLAVEWDDHAAATFSANLPGVPMHQGDIELVDPSILALAPGELDVLDGSPPCQGFSTAGSRNLNDSRNGLFRQYVRLLDAWAPKTFVMENVSGLVRGKMRFVFVEILAALKAAGPGYRVRAQLLNAQYFRVPQARQRLVFIGVRADLDAQPTYPKPMSAAPTVRDAWSGLADPGLAPTPKVGQQQEILARHILPGKSGADALKRGGRKANGYGICRLAWDRPAPTVLKSWSEGSWTGQLHPSEHRFVGVRELARLQSFPDEYAWGDSTYQQIHARIGNSVPPLLMRAVATAVRGTLDHIGGK